MTAAELASPRYLSGIDAIEAHPAGIRRHAPAKTILVWNHAHLTEAATASLPLMQAMCTDELEHHGGILFA